MSRIAGLLQRFGFAVDSARAVPEDTRWVVLDCESSGLDPHSDRLLSIGAVGVRAGTIILGDAFSVLLRQSRASAPDNILVHGIGDTDQLSGESPERALSAFDAFAGDAPLAGFHTSFDQALLERAFREVTARAWRRRWLDLALLAPVLFPKLARGRTALDDWLAVFEIDHPARHDALADAYATAQLLLVLLRAARDQGLNNVGAIRRAAGSRKWLPH
jgi:DNA polymerase III subunit epsilon